MAESTLVTCKGYWSNTQANTMLESFAGWSAHAAGNLNARQAMHILLAFEPRTRLLRIASCGVLRVPDSSMVAATG